MPEKIGQKILFTMMNLLGSLAIMFIILAATNKLGKADVAYVDKQDSAIKADFDFYRVSHEQAHGKEYKAIQDQLEIIQRSSEQQIELLIRLINERE